MGHPVTVAILSVLALVELVTDQLPKTPSRTTLPQFIVRLITGGFAGAVLGTPWGWGYTWGGLVTGAVGAVLGTLGGHQARKRLAASVGRTCRSRCSRTSSRWVAAS